MWPSLTSLSFILPRQSINVWLHPNLLNFIKQIRTGLNYYRHAFIYQHIVIKETYCKGTILLFDSSWLAPKWRIKLGIFFDQLSSSRYRSVIKPFD